MFDIIRKLLFSLSPETSHEVTFYLLNLAEKIGLAACWQQQFTQSVNVMGLQFQNPVGLAAGLDKNGDYIDALARFGFGFIEVGSVTPQPQSGNAKPRLFRLPKHEALINRLGFNNKGVDYLCERVSRVQYRGMLGINIGKNASTPLKRATDDYLICLEKVFSLASYIVVNISSPNTAGLRQLQHDDFLIDLLSRLKNKQNELVKRYQKYVPLVIKVAPDLTVSEIDSMAQHFLDHQIDGVIATNTTLQRPTLEQHPVAKENGGLSGKPLLPLANQTLNLFEQKLHGKIPLIGVGGIMSAQDALTKKQLGASLVQIYSGFIYRGPRLVGEICQGWG